EKAAGKIKSISQPRVLSRDRAPDGYRRRAVSDVAITFLHAARRSEQDQGPSTRNVEMLHHRYRNGRGCARRARSSPPRAAPR
ncbi:MAG: hypothetical protein P8X95_23225, partial [Anaerolineales bacterium]